MKPIGAHKNPACRRRQTQQTLASGRVNRTDQRRLDQILTALKKPPFPSLLEEGTLHDGGKTQLNPGEALEREGADKLRSTGRGSQTDATRVASSSAINE